MDLLEILNIVLNVLLVSVSLLAILFSVLGYIRNKKWEESTDFNNRIDSMLYVKLFITLVILIILKILVV